MLPWHYPVLLVDPAVHSERYLRESTLATHLKIRPGYPELVGDEQHTHIFGAAPGNGPTGVVEIRGSGGQRWSKPSLRLERRLP